MTSTEQEDRVIAAVPKDLYIGETWRPAAGGKQFEVFNPASGEVLCRIADASPVDAEEAIAAATAAQRSFARMAPRARADLLMRVYELLHANIADLALLMTLEMGKPLAESAGEIRYAAEFFRHFAEEAVRISGSYQVTPSGTDRFLVMRQAVGPSLLITPWNFPMAMGTRKIGPAIAAGCTSIIKPAPQTPLSLLALGRLLEQAELPAGVVNILPTSNAAALVEPMLASRQIRKLSFTGSTAVGRKLLEQCGDGVVRTSMELGGNAPFLVFADADISTAVEGALAAKMRNGGEACTAANRFYVHSDVAEAFSKELARRMNELRVGPGTEEGVRLGPLIDRAAVEKVGRLVEDAVSRGAKAIVGGRPVDRKGYFYEPTVLTDVPADARLMHEEIFGPIAPITEFVTEEEAVNAANDTEYGLVGYVFTRDLNRAIRVAEALEVGMVGINKGVVSDPAAPFGGIKASGLGREGGPTGIDEYLETKYVALAIN